MINANRKLLIHHEQVVEHDSQKEKDSDVMN